MTFLDEDFVSLKKSISYLEWNDEDSIQQSQAASSSSQSPVNEYHRNQLREQLAKAGTNTNQKRDIDSRLFRTSEYDSQGGLTYPTDRIILEFSSNELMLSESQKLLLKKLNQEVPGILQDSLPEKGRPGPKVFNQVPDGGSAIAAYAEPLQSANTPATLIVSTFALLKNLEDQPEKKFRQLVVAVSADGTISDVNNEQKAKHYVLAQLYLLQNRYGKKITEDGKEQIYRPKKLAAVCQAIAAVSTSASLESEAVKQALATMQQEIKKTVWLPRPSKFGLDSEGTGLENLLKNGQSVIKAVINGELSALMAGQNSNDATPRRRPS